MSDLDNESFGGPPPPPPPPMPPGGDSADSGAGGPAPPPPPPPPGMGMMPTYKQQKDQADQESGKSLAEKLAGGKKSESKPFNYGITADQLKTPSQIKAARAAAAAAGGSSTPDRPSTPSFGTRRPSNEFNNTVRRPSQDQTNHDVPAGPGPSSIKSLASQIQALRTQPAQASAEQNHYAASNTPSANAYGSRPETPSAAAPAPHKPPAPSNDIYGSHGISSTFGQRPAAQTSVQPAAPSYHDPLSDWVSSNAHQNERASSMSPAHYSSSPQPTYQQASRSPAQSQVPSYTTSPTPAAYNMSSPTPSAQPSYRSTATLVRQESQGEKTRAAQMLEQIRNNYSNSTAPVQYQQAPPPVPTGNSPAFYGNSNAHAARPSYNQNQNQNQAMSSRPQQTSYASSPYQNTSPVPNQQSSMYKNQPAYTQPTYSSQPTYRQASSSPQPGHQLQRQSSTDQNQQYINPSLQQRQAPELSTYRTLPYAAYVTPTNVDFDESPFWNSTPSNSFSHQQQQQQQAPRHQVRTEIQLPIRQSNSPDFFNSGYRQSPQPSFERVIPVQIQYQQVAPNRSNWNQTGLSDF